MLSAAHRNRSAEPAPLVALLHGSAGSPRQWQSHMQTLSLRCRVMAPALLGYSGTPEWSAEALVSLRSEAAHLEHILDIAPDGVHLVGHGYGAAVALHFALLHPDRVRSLALYEPTLFHLLRERTPHAPAETAVGAALRAAVQRRYEAGDLIGAAWVFVDYWCGDGAWQRLSPTRQQSIAARMPKVAAELHAVLAETTPITHYADLRMPVLLLHGQRTRTTARQIAEHLAGAMRRAQLIEVPGADHMGAVSQPEALCKLLGGFLESQRDAEQRFAWTRVPRHRIDRGVDAQHASGLPLRGAPAT
jgi:pimeloyl-ACP methyl ester carboxylesterase